jgi:HK97 family phage major capsid protein
MSKTLELKQKRATLIQEMHDLTEATSFPEEAQKRWNTLDAEQKSLETQINMVESTHTLREGLEKVDHREGNQPGASLPGSPSTAIQPTEQEARAKALFDKRSSKTYEDAFNKTLRTGQYHPELRTYSEMDTTSGAAGDYLVPVGFQKELETKLKYYGGMRNVCRVITTSTGNTLDWPTWDDTANTGEWLSQGSTVGQQNPTLGNVTFTSNIADSKQVLVNVTLLNDSAFDLQDELSTAFAIRLNRVTNLAYTSGNGSGQPTGLLNGVGSTGITNIEYAVGANSNNSTSSYNEVNSIGTDDLSNLIAGIDPLYRPNAKFMATQATFDFLRKVKDGFGRPIWEPSIDAASPDKIFGYGYQWNADMSGIGASNNSMVFGDFSKYVIRDVGGITFFIFNETYMASLQRGFVSFLRTDGQLLQPAAFAVLQHRLS